MARRKITEGETPDEELPDLTPQQMKFVEGIASGKTASDALRAAYDTSNYSQNAIWVDASRLKANPKVRLWLDALQAAGMSRISCSREEHLAELERLRNKAERTGNMGAAVQAEQLRGKVAGHYVDRIQEVPAEAGNPHDTLDQIAAEQGHDVAMRFAEAAGIKNWQPQNETRH